MRGNDWTLADSASRPRRAPLAFVRGNDLAPADFALVRGNDKTPAYFASERGNGGAMADIRP